MHKLYVDKRRIDIQFVMLCRFFPVMQLIVFFFNKLKFLDEKMSNSPYILFYSTNPCHLY